MWDDYEDYYFPDSDSETNYAITRYSSLQKEMNMFFSDEKFESFKKTKEYINDEIMYFFSPESIPLVFDAEEKVDGKEVGLPNTFLIVQNGYK